MKKNEFTQSYYIYDTSSIVKNTKLYLDEDILLSRIVNEDFFRRKNIINFEYIQSLDKSIVNYAKDVNLIKEGSFKIDSTSKVLAKFSEITFDSNDIDLLVGKSYYYQLYAFVDLPHSSLVLSKEKREEYKFKESEVFNLYIVISPFSLSKNISNPFYARRRIFDTFGALGFLLIDINKFNSFLKNHKRKIDNNLFEEFTTTELAK